MSARDLVVQTVALAGGEVTGRVRLQKLLYLLCKRGLTADLGFTYHHYGPFSRAIDEGISSAKAFCNLREVTKRRATDGFPFSVFILDGKAPPICIDGIEANEATRLIREIVAVPSTVAEIAATIHWLRFEEQVNDWQSELVRRKGAKTRDGRIGQALDLLQTLGFNREIFYPVICYIQ